MRHLENNCTKFTYALKGMGFDDQMRGLKHLTRFTYDLETDEGNGK
jgi:hypothetical protein